MTSRLVTLRTRVRRYVREQQLPVPPGSVTPIMFSCHSPIRMLKRGLMIGVSIPVQMTMVPGVLSTNTTLIQLHNQLPNNQTNNVPRCHIQNGSSWPARFSLVNCWRPTVLSVTQCHVCQLWLKPIIPENFAGIKKPSGWQITSICFSASLSIRAFFYRFCFHRTPLFLDKSQGRHRDSSVAAGGDTTRPEAVVFL